MRARHAVIATAVAVLCSGGPTASPAAADNSGLPVPARSRPVAGSHYISGKTFRETVVFFRTHLSRRGYEHREIPVYGYRGVVVSRFLAAEGPSPWKAVHIFRLAGKTHIYIVPTPDKALDRSRLIE